MLYAISHPTSHIPIPPIILSISSESLVNISSSSAILDAAVIASTPP
jgi:hypothetical protein